MWPQSVSQTTYREKKCGTQSNEMVTITISISIAITITITMALTTVK
jgi:hypothetical protein